MDISCLLGVALHHHTATMPFVILGGQLRKTCQHELRWIMDSMLILTNFQSYVIIHHLIEKEKFYSFWMLGVTFQKPLLKLGA